MPVVVLPRESSALPLRRPRTIVSGSVRPSELECPFPRCGKLLARGAPGNARSSPLDSYPRQLEARSIFPQHGRRPRAERILSCDQEFLDNNQAARRTSVIKVTAGFFFSIAHRSTLSYVKFGRRAARSPLGATLHAWLHSRPRYLHSFQPPFTRCLPSRKSIARGTQIRAKKYILQTHTEKKIT